MPDDPPDETPPRPPETPRELAEEAARCESRARWHRAMADSLERQAVNLRERERLARAGTLPRVVTGSSVTGNMVTDRRLAISKGRTGKDKFAAARRAKGYTMLSLAEAVGCSRPMLSMHRQEGGRPIPQERADKIAKLIDWPADRAHWPNGIVS